ncbi:hypothetical protein [Mesorhizobium sp.]|uniref:hypothetical protein n=1 Tax=Mesorhizobium sp. TaxID=1871066 RepID=UPI000FE5A5DB|nr:hypothetical protein [Mesorhizobium sp.]RWP29506.1 MAG: hypothetical protein EOR03_26635 [Mesorhizobium sp.]
MLAKFIATMCATAAGSFALACSVPAEPEPAPLYEVRVVTYDGQLFIAGRGDDCVSAWQGAVIPKGWQQIICVESDKLEFSFAF